jgi:threonine/homoserine/homoserine lactone efflux protein
VFSIVLDSSTSLLLLSLYGAYMSLATFVWFAFISYLFTNQEMVKKYGKFSSKFEKILGCILLLIASQILLYEIPKINV